MSADPLITPDILLRAYAVGVFPMSESRDDPNLFWVEPNKRAIMPLDRFHVPKRLARTVRTDKFEIRTDHDFEAVIAACAGDDITQSAAPEREETWINTRIRTLYGELFALGHVHTVECWLDEKLVGGLYGVSLGGAFFGESMFHRATDASKVALVHLVARLIAGGYRLLDAQFQTAHLTQFGTLELPRKRYQAVLANALETRGDWHGWEASGARMDGAAAMAIIGGSASSA
ncbi:MAG: leucyl/phenylalanyl-tRNA--protein transferase [Bosea sp. (in: a-proteobacteria)]